jgi:hypothetical protein
MFLVTTLIASFVGYASALDSFTMVTQFVRPSSAVPLSNNLVGFSIESDRWNDWTGSLSHPNNLTCTLLHNLKQKTGVASPIRFAVQPRLAYHRLIRCSVGGDTEDRLKWSPDVNGVDNTFPPVPDVITATKQLFPEASHGRIGGDWILLSGNLPKGTTIIWGVNFAANSLNETVTQVREIEKAFRVNRSISNESRHILTAINRMIVSNQ